MTEAAGNAVEVNISVDWSGVAVPPVIYINQFIAQLGPPTRNGVPDGVYLLFGNVTPPLIVGDNADARRPYIEAAMKKGIRPEIHAHFYLSRDRLEELIRALNTIMENFSDAEKVYKTRTGKAEVAEEIT